MLSSLGNVPDESSRLAILSEGDTPPHRYVSHSLVIVRCRPRSAFGCALAYEATSVIQGVGIITLADETARLSSASKLAESMEWAIPRSSAWRIRSFELAGYPSRSAT